MLKYLLLLAILPLILITSFGVTAYSQSHIHVNGSCNQTSSDPTSLSLLITADEGSNTIIVNGHTTVIQQGVTLSVSAPNGNILYITQITPDSNGKFEVELTTTNPLWKQNGIYIFQGVQYITHGSYDNLLAGVEVNNHLTSETEICVGSYYPDETEPALPSTQTPSFGFCVTAEPNTDIITVTGYTENNITDVTFRVTSPSGNNVVAIDQVTPDGDGNFTATFEVTQIWRENGFYKITAKQSIQQNLLYIVSEYVEVSKGMTLQTDVCVGSYPPVETIPLTITTDKRSYIQGETITITGQTPSTYNILNISLTSPTHGLVDTIDNITITDNQFATNMNTGNNTSIQTAETYTLTAIYGTDTASTTFHYGYPIDGGDEYFIPDSSYIILADHEISKWTHQIEKWENAQNRTDTNIERLYEKLDKAITRNQTDKIETYTEKIGHSMALSELYDGLIECLEEQLELFS